MGREEEKADSGREAPTQPAGQGGQPRCDACGAEMKPMGHCKYWCLKCGFLRTCNDVL